MALGWGLWLDGASGVVLVALAAFVASVRPRRGTNLLFALYAAAFGIYWVLVNLLPLDAPVRAPAGSLLAVTAVGALFAFLLAFPRPVPRRGLAVAVALAPALYYAALRFAVFAAPGAGGGADPARFGGTALAGSIWGGLALLALRYREASGPYADRERRGLALMSAAFSVWVSVIVGRLVVAEETPWRLALLALPGGLAVAWLRLTTRHAATAAAARAVAWTALAATLGGMLVAILLTADQDSGVGGVARSVGVIVFAYAILRHQLFDIDVKVRWTVKQSTLAALFIGVFFVVSEGATLLFEGWTDSEYLGIAAAGALVFALAPLQRAAERLAEKAVPGGSREPHVLLELKRDAYRSALAIAWRDGRLDRGEARHLADLRVVLALPPEEYAALEREPASGREGAEPVATVPR